MSWFRFARDRKFSFYSKTGIVIFSIAIAIVLISNVVIAASGPKNVRGFVWDSMGREVEGADITVNMRWASDDSIRHTVTDTTDSSGFYSVTFGPANWDIGDRIEVIATWGAGQDSNSTTANSAPLQWVNVTFPFEIPVFGSTIGFLIAGALLGAVAIIFLVRKRN